MIFLISLAAIASGPVPDRPALILVTDCGASIDDQFALLHLALSPEIDLRGVLTTHAANLDPPASESSARSAREVLNWAGVAPTPPVIAGLPHAMANSNASDRNPAVDFLIAESRNHAADRRLCVAVIGPMTDVAIALNRDPSIADRIEILAMAFDDRTRGGDLWNVKLDSVAWQVLLKSRVPIVIGDDLATRQALKLSKADAHAWFSGKSRGGDALSKAFATFLDRNAGTAKLLLGSADAFPIWDEVVVAHLLGMTRLEKLPRPLLRDDLTFDSVNASGTIGWIRSIESDRLWKDFREKLDRKK